jgi:hypothetical protein
VAEKIIAVQDRSRVTGAARIHAALADTALRHGRKHRSHRNDTAPT